MNSIRSITILLKVLLGCKVYRTEHIPIEVNWRFTTDISAMGIEITR